MPQTREMKQNDLPSPIPATLPASVATVPANGHLAEDVLCQIEVHPLARLAGKYNDEPLWDDFLQAMQEVRRQMNAQEETTE